MSALLSISACIRDAWHSHKPRQERMNDFWKCSEVTRVSAGWMLNSIGDAHPASYSRYIYIYIYIYIYRYRYIIYWERSIAAMRRGTLDRIQDSAGSLCITWPVTCTSSIHLLSSLHSLSLVTTHQHVQLHILCTTILRFNDILIFRAYLNIPLYIFLLILYLLYILNIDIDNRQCSVCGRWPVPGDHPSRVFF